ncbi:hypothetical protein [uncultured Pluralibacter sp.]|uniref:hypothetical protein n=1 Tax=uncultured Pluralibacter sp. TaxID=1490864 RepID=UPI00260D3F4A|nr:hypothetical protein [uncultured Pluralibacter sp.]
MILKKNCVRWLFVLTAFFLSINSYAVEETPTPLSITYWTSEGNLCAHWIKHKDEDREWAADINAYAASVLVPRDFTTGVESFMGADGLNYRYYGEDNMLAIFNSDNRAVTAYRPSGGRGYWNRLRQRQEQLPQPELDTTSTVRCGSFSGDPSHGEF